jgi:hypothetical protein
MAFLAALASDELKDSGNLRVLVRPSVPKTDTVALIPWPIASRMRSAAPDPTLML